MHKHEYTAEIGRKTVTATFTDLADQADGSVMISSGGTVVLATAVMSHNRKDADFFPLVVDYEEKFYAAGQILGSRFMRREGKPSEEATLSARVIDRTIRPLFDHAIRQEVQIVITVLAIDEDDPDVLAINAASLALATSDIPWNGPVSAVRIGLSEPDDAGQSSVLVNPAFSERSSTNTLDATICGKDLPAPQSDAPRQAGGQINMIEAGALEISEEKMGKVLEYAQKEIAKMQEFQERVIKERGKEKREVSKDELPDGTKALFNEHIAPRLPNVVFTAGKNTHVPLKEEWVALFKEHFPDTKSTLAGAYFEEEVDAVIHTAAVERDERADGRALDEVRSLYAQAGGISPIHHGTGVFYRGGTHVLSVLTLGGPKDAQLVEGMEVQETKRFMHHYNFPPFSAGETGRIGGTNRRMIGHGALAERALAAVIPSQEEFPYTIRLVSESLASNGSTSMASVCAGTLALMDGGVPIKRPVAGIAMGLMMENPKSQIQNENQQGGYQIPDTKYRILTDIQGPEDHHGDMDFKVAGTSVGITAVQMDVKVDGIPIGILKEAFAQARIARKTILGTIQEAIPAPRPELKPSAPKIIRLNIKPDQIGTVIGPSGKTINRITEETGAHITIEDDGTVYITGNEGRAEKAAEEVEAITHEYKPGERYEGEITRLMDFGAFVKIGPNAEGLVHISEFAPVHVSAVSDLVSVGDRVPVIVKEIDEKSRINLSIKQANPDFFKDTLQ